MAQTEIPTIRPILRLEKPKYVFGEVIRFWVGVEVTGTVPEAMQKACSLEVVSPDGHTRVQSVGWPIDGMVDRGWMGGAGFNPETAGVYNVAFACAGGRTAPVAVAVENDPIVHDIKIEFQYGKSGNIGADDVIPVTFIVKNQSRYTIRFAKPGEMMQGISIRIERKEPQYRAELFYPWDKLSHSGTSFDKYTWHTAKLIPSIVLAPGQHFEQQLSLQDAYKFDAAGQYEVTFSTVLAILVGESDGSFVDLCPIRLGARNTQEFTLSTAIP